jgi:hypothetical protein
MNWFVMTVAGSPIGPLAEQQVVEMIRSGASVIGVARQGDATWSHPRYYPAFAAAFGGPGWRPPNNGNHAAEAAGDRRPARPELSSWDFAATAVTLCMFPPAAIALLWMKELGSKAVRISLTGLAVVWFLFPWAIALALPPDPQEATKATVDKVGPEEMAPASAVASASAPGPSAGIAAQPSTTLSAAPEVTVAVAQLGARLGEKLAAADTAIAAAKWETAAGLLSEARGVAEAEPEAVRSHAQIEALGKRQVQLRAKSAEFDARLFEALYQRLMVDEFKEPAGLTPAAALEWDKKDEVRKTREVAKKFGVSEKYADRVFQEGPILERMAKEAERDRAADAAQRAALADKCGREVRPSWSGTPTAVNDYLDETLKDPDSKKDLRCSDPRLTSEHCWVTTCTFRAKNGFGAYVLAGHMFHTTRDHVVHAEPL